MIQFNYITDDKNYIYSLIILLYFRNVYINILT